MPKQFKTARKMNKLKLKDAADMLGVSQPTLSSWESGRKSPTIDGLLKMSALYKVSTDFLLGRAKTAESMISDKIVPNSNLRIMHGQPVWSKEYGWMIVDSLNIYLISADNIRIPFTDDVNLYYKAENFAEGLVSKEIPLSSSEISKYNKVWVEPISSDELMRSELRSWYYVKEHWVENDFGSRFYLGTYGSKWIAFQENSINKL